MCAHENLYCSRAIAMRCFMAGTYLVAALPLAGCGRIAFDARGNGGDARGDGTGDTLFSQPLTLPCNQPVKVVAIADPTSAHVSSFGGASRLGAVWTTDAGKPASATGIIGPPDTISMGT